jgi:serine/threonine-protein kinase SRK2
MKGQTAPLIKLCDFGFSKDHFDSSPKTPVGTAFFLAPEVIMSDRSNSYAVEASDTWACGIVLFSSLFSGHPYLLKEHLESKRCPFILKMVQNCKEGKIFFPSWAEQLIPSAVGLLSRILEPDPKIRMTIPEIIQHPWFQENLEPGIIARNSTMEATKDPLQTFETIQGIIMQACRKKEGNLQPSNASILNSVIEEMKLRAKTG